VRRKFGGFDQRFSEEVLYYNNADEVWKRCYETNIQICWASVLVDLKDYEIVLQPIRLAFALKQTLFKLKNANKIILYFSVLTFGKFRCSPKLRHH